MVHKHSENSRIEIVGINQDILGESKNHIDQALKKQLEKSGTIIKINTVRPG